MLRPTCNRRFVIFVASAARMGAAQEAGSSNSGDKVIGEWRAGNSYFDPETPSVDCGGHFAETCTACPGEGGYSWCNGDCVWVWNRCTRVSGALTPAGQVVPLSQAVLVCAPFTLIFFIILWLYAIVYRSKVVDRFPRDIAQRDPEKDLRRARSFGLFAVFSNTSTALWAFLCTPVLAAKNYHVGNVCGFWTSCLLLTVTMYSPFFCVAVAIRAVLSGLLKRNLRYESNCIKDCFCGMFCFPCEVGRESLEVDDEEYMEVSCPFVVESTWSEPRKTLHRIEEDEDDHADCHCAPYDRNWCSHNGFCCNKLMHELVH